MKHLSYCLLIGFLVVGCSESPEAYNKRLQVVADSLASYGSLSLSMGAAIAEEWNGAIEHPKDKLDESGQKIPNQIYSYLFEKETKEDAIARTLKEYSGATEAIAKQKTTLDSMMKSINEPPSESNAKHAKLLEMYGLYTKTVEAATAPSGSLMAYSSTLRELSSELKRLHNELAVL